MLTLICIALIALSLYCYVSEDGGAVKKWKDKTGNARKKSTQQEKKLLLRVDDILVDEEDPLEKSQRNLDLLDSRKMNTENLQEGSSLIDNAKSLRFDQIKPRESTTGGIVGYAFQDKSESAKRADAMIDSENEHWKDD